ncbi:hypothetical protein [Streptomyces sp. NPDC003327]
MFWMVALLGLDGQQYVYRVYAPRAALPGDLFWAAYHCHEEDGAPRASDAFDSAEIRWIGQDADPTPTELTVHRH